MRVQKSATIYKAPADRYAECIYEVSLDHITEEMGIRFRFDRGRDVVRHRVLLTVEEARKLAESLLKMADLAETRTEGN